jgi:DNA-binding response OmpR family regulator
MGEDHMPQTILLVDDDEDIKYIIKSALQKEGYEVILAANGQQALKLIEKQAPDLMVTDLNMPVMDGWHFSMWVRRDPRYQTTPIIVLSALLDRESTPEKFELGTYYFPKPFDIFRLIDKIKELLKNTGAND